MNRIQKANPDGKAEKKRKLRDLQAGDYFRLPTSSFEEVFGEEGGGHLFMVINVQPQKAGRVTAVSADGKLVRELDDDREVIQHATVLHVSEAEKS